MNKRPTRTILGGDKELAATHIGDVRRVLFQLENIQKTNKYINTISKRYQDGTVISATTNIGSMDIVKITSGISQQKKNHYEQVGTYSFPVPFIPVADDTEALSPTGVYVAKFFYGFMQEYVERKERKDESVTDYIIKYGFKPISDIERVKLDELDEVGVVDDWDYTDQTETESASYEKFPDVPIEDQDECPTFLQWFYLGGKIGIGTGFYHDYIYYSTEGEEIRPWAWYSYGGLDCTSSDEGEWSASYDYSLIDAFIVNGISETKESHRIIHGTGDGSFVIDSEHTKNDYTIHNNYDLDYTYSDLLGSAVDSENEKFCYAYWEEVQNLSIREELTGTVNFLTDGGTFFLRTPFCMGANSIEENTPITFYIKFKTPNNEYILCEEYHDDIGYGFDALLDCKMFYSGGEAIYYYRAVFADFIDERDDIFEYGYEYKNELFRIRFKAIYVSTTETEKSHSFYYHKFDTATVILPNDDEREIDFSENKSLVNKFGMYMRYDDDFRLKFGKYTIEKRESINE